MEGDRPLQALFYMLAAQFLFSSNILLLRVTELMERSHGDPGFKLSPWEAMLYRSVLLLLWCAFCLWRRPGKALETREKFWLGARGVAGVLSLTAYYYAVLHIPLGMASLFSNSSPLYVTVLALLFGGELLTRMRWVSLFGGFLGVALVVWGGSLNQNSIDPFALLIAASSGPLAATAYFSIRQLKNIRNEQIMIALGLAGTVLAAPVLLFKGSAFPKSMIAHAWLVASVIPAIFAQECLTRAFRAAPASQVTPLQYTGPLFSTFFALIFLGERIPLASGFGIAVVVLFGLAIPYWEAKRS